MESHGLTTEEVLRWFDEGEKSGQDFMILVEDKIRCETFPVYVSPNRSLEAALQKWKGKMIKIIAKYDLSRPFSEQSDSFRWIAFN